MTVDPSELAAWNEQQERCRAEYARRPSTVHLNQSGHGPAGRLDALGINGRDVREWARANGHTVSDRGVIRSDIVDDYLTAHGREETP